MRIAICGAGGFLGTHISRSLVANGYEVIRIGREHFKSNNDLSYSLDGCDVIINVCGAPIVGKWDEVYKHELYISRIETTKKLLKAIDQLLLDKPKVFLSISSVGIYQQGITHDESSTQYGTTYLALLAREWENEAMKAQNYGLRTVILRLGAVLGTDGGILKEAEFAFKTPIGMVPGDGKQPFSWVHIDDVFNVIQKVLNTTGMEGTYNVVAPEKVTMHNFIQAIGKCIHRPVFLRAPKWLMRWRYGEGSQSILQGTYVTSKRLEKEGHEFKFKTLQEALKGIFKT